MLMKDLRKQANLTDVFYQYNANFEIRSAKTLFEKMQRIDEYLSELDKFSSRKNSLSKYGDIILEADGYFWENLETKKYQVIYKGFDAYAQLRFKKNLTESQIRLYVSDAFTSEQEIAMDSVFFESVNRNVVQYDILQEAKQQIYSESCQLLDKVWEYEFKRIQEWIKHISKL